MEFKNAVSILITKFGTVYRTLIFVFIVLLLIIAIASCFYVPTKNNLIEDPQLAIMLDRTHRDVDAYFHGDVNLAEAVREVKNDVVIMVDYIRDSTNAFANIIIMLIVALVLYRFCTSLCFVTVTDIYSQFMQSNLRYGFLSNFFKNLGQNVRYSLGYTLFTVIADLIITFAAFGFIILTFAYLGIFSLTITTVLVIALSALRMTLMSGILPYMVLEGNKSFFKALKKSLPMVKRNMAGYLRSIVLTLLIFFTMNAVAGLPTFGIAIIMSISMLISINRILELCFYYKDKKARYYVDQNTIVDTLPLTERKDLEVNL